MAVASVVRIRVLYIIWYSRKINRGAFVPDTGMGEGLTSKAAERHGQEPHIYTHTQYLPVHIHIHTIAPNDQYDFLALPFLPPSTPHYDVYNASWTYIFIYVRRYIYINCNTGETANSTRSLYAARRRPIGAVRSSTARARSRTTLPYPPPLQYFSRVQYNVTTTPARHRKIVKGRGRGYNAL